MATRHGLTCSEQRHRAPGKNLAAIESPGKPASETRAQKSFEHALLLPLCRSMKSRMDSAWSPGLYIVATPIGNLGDITLRGIETLRGVAAVACEDTRMTGKLLNHLGIKKRMIRYDDHASDETREHLLALMAEQAIALVSDAGTPLISDPGFRLVRDARERGIAVTSLPGASAVVMALTLAGLPTDRFLFAGFLPNKDKARRDVLAELAEVPATLVFYETAPRLGASLAAIGEVLPGR